MFQYSTGMMVLIQPACTISMKKDGIQ